MWKAFTVLGAVSIIGLSVLAETPTYAGDDWCFPGPNDETTCVPKKKVRQILRDHGEFCFGNRNNEVECLPAKQVRQILRDEDGDVGEDDDAADRYPQRQDND